MSESGIGAGFLNKLRHKNVNTVMPGDTATELPQEDRQAMEDHKRRFQIRYPFQKQMMSNQAITQPGENTTELHPGDAEAMKAHDDH